MKPKIKPMWRGEIHQGGLMVACVEHTDQKTVRRELKHYATQYVSEGPITIIGPRVLVTAPPKRRKRHVKR